MHTNIDIVGFDAQAVRTSAGLLDCAQPTDLARPTPCTDWTLHGLIAHMVDQHYGFAAAATGDGDPARWRSYRLGPDPVADYRVSAQAVLAAFATAGVLDRQFPLPGFSTGPSATARQAIGFHFVDYVVHSWDIARTLDVDVRFPPDLLAAALDVAEAVPDGENRLAPGAAFAPALPAPDGSLMDRVVAALGRSPGWKRPR